MIPSLRQAFEDKGIDPRLGFAANEVIKAHRRLVLNSLSTHHTIPTSIGGSESNDNKQLLIHRKHDAIHAVFDNQPPHQKVRQILEEDQGVLQTGFISSMDDMITRAERKGYVYKKGVWRRE